MLLNLNHLDQVYKVVPGLKFLLSYGLLMLSNLQVVKASSHPCPFS